MKFIFTILFFLFVNSVIYSQCIELWGKKERKVDMIYYDSIPEYVTNNIEIDKFIRKNVSALSKLLEVSYAKIRFMNEDNASAGGDKKLSFGIPLIQKLLTQKDGHTKLLYIIAHEMSHLYQYQHGYNKNIFFKESTDKHVELQADLLATNVVMSNITLKQGQTKDDILEIFRSAADEIGDTYFEHAGHHGMGSEREKACRNGASMVNVDIHRVFQESFLRVCSPCVTKAMGTDKFMGFVYINKQKKYYVAMDNEVYIKIDERYKQVGVLREDTSQLATTTMEIVNEYGEIIKYKISWSKVYDSEGVEIGELRPNRDVIRGY